MRGRLTDARGAVFAAPACAWAELDARLDPASSRPVALGLSGGSDSRALLHLAAAWCARAGRPLLALTVDHGLHPEGAHWTAAAGRAAREAGAGWRALSWTGPKPAAGLPAAARRARHALLADAAREAGATVILLGHTADDVTEGERMREADARGLGRLRPWSASPAWPQGRGIMLSRPLLAVRREELRARLVAAGRGDWLDDPANADARFARARARAVLEGAPAAAGDADAEGDRALAVLARAVRERADATLAWPRAAWAAAPARSRRRLLAAALTCAGGGDRPPRGPVLLAAEAALLAGGPVRRTLAGARLEAEGDEVRAGREPGERRRGGLAAVDAPSGRTVVWDGRFEVEAAAPGWRVAPLVGRAARLPRADRAALARVPAAARPALTVLVDVEGSVRLPAPFGAGDAPGRALGLVGARLRLACAPPPREADL